MNTSKAWTIATLSLLFTLRALGLKYSYRWFSLIYYRLIINGMLMVLTGQTVNAAWIAARHNS
ncbi:MAG TPA: hypothetical protein VE863_10295 [Pyrinomonadaceae bacterium]|jgi:hypothetical protein|nr:hypothetical protein [Pyrinomonadaceae bacterium]